MSIPDFAVPMRARMSATAGTWTQSLSEAAKSTVDGGGVIWTEKVSKASGRSDATVISQVDLDEGPGLVNIFVKMVW